MAIEESCLVCKRKLLVRLVRKDGVSVSEAARQAGLSRQKAYKWLDRYDAKGELGLQDGSRARRDPGRWDGAAKTALVALRRKHPTWGARKLLDRLRATGAKNLPAPSTAGELLKRKGMIEPRPRRQIHVPFRYAGPAPYEPNRLWTMDFKGDFSLGNRERCLPFTLRDAASRMILSVRVMDAPRAELVIAELKKCFQKHGMPFEIQSDGGPPFATAGLARLSEVSVWLLKLGIIPVLSRPGKPQDNGGHERMHRDLKAETTRPSGFNAGAQQRKFNRFVHTFNHERPHEALDGKTPISRFAPSSRAFPAKIEPPDYPAWWQARLVNTGTLSWHNQQIKINNSLHGERIAFEPFDDGLWRIHFYGFVIGLLDERGAKPIILTTQRRSGRLAAEPEKV